MFAAASPLIVFAITLFTSAFFLFLVQPMVGKQILPKLGGAPAVWSTCMLFYQAVLLAGYTYAHFVTQKLKPRQQLYFHFSLMALVLGAFALFPVGYAYKSLNPTGDLTNVTEVVFWVLLILTPIIGLPFFVVSATAPLFQRWFSHTGHPAAKDPYFLYAASNLGSMISLFVYPTLVEMNMGLPPQGVLWMVGYAVLLALALWCGYLVLQHLPEDTPVLQTADVPAAAAVAVTANGASALADVPDAEQEAEDAITDKPGDVVVKTKKKRAKDRAKAATLDAFSREPSGPLGRDPGPSSDEPAQPQVPLTPPSAETGPGVKQYLRWILLGFVPSSLMLGVTMYMTTDVSPVPFLWLIPLALYLLSFIIVFSQSFDYAFRGTLGAPLWFVNKDPQAVLGSGVTIHALMTLLLPVVVLLMVFQVVSGHDFFSSLWMRFAVHLGAMFLVAMVCHGELARTRPATQYLTSFYLAMSFGGVLGGMFNALIAPVIFNGVAEYSLILVVACLLLPPMWEENRSQFNRIVDIFLAAALSAAGVYVIILYLARYLGWDWQVGVYQSLPTFGALPGLQIQAAGYLMIVLGSAAFIYYVATGPKAQRLERILDLALPAALCLLSMLIMGMAPFDLWTTKNSLIFGIIARPFEWLPKPWQPVDITLFLRSAFTYGIPVALCYGFAERPIRLGLGVGAILLASALQPPIEDYGRYVDHTVYRERSFFGVLKVEHQRLKVLDENENIAYKTLYHKLLHGTTLHGMQRSNWEPDTESVAIIARPLAFSSPLQVLGGWAPYAFTDPELAWKAWQLHVTDPRQEALTYYHSTGPIGQVYKALIAGKDYTAPVAFIGLGTGTMASYIHPGQKADFYEIDHAVVRIAEDPQHFTYLQNARERGGDYEFKMGDARLMVAKAPDNHYKLIVVDAFSSDAIPVHLTTKEAIALYLSKLRDDGVVAMHISNRHLNLEPVLANIAADLGAAVIEQYDNKDDDFPGKNASDWVMIAKSPAAFAKFQDGMWRWPNDTGRNWKDLLHKGDAQKLSAEDIAAWKKLHQGVEEREVMEQAEFEPDEEYRKEVTQRIQQLKHVPDDEEYQKIRQKVYEEMVKKRAEEKLAVIEKKWAAEPDAIIRQTIQKQMDEMWNANLALREKVGVWTDDFSNILSIWGK